MRRANIRPSIQIGIMFFIVGLAAITGWACSCGSGSDLIPGLKTRDYVLAPGVIERWHNFQGENFTATTKDLNSLRDFTQGGQAGVGILLPQAPGASQPGTLSGNPQIFVNYIAGGQPYYYFIPLASDPAMAAQLESMMPAPAGMQWQALSPANYDWLTQVPTQTASFENMMGNLNYQVDFHGADVCVHCEVKLTGCTSAKLSFSQQAGLWMFGKDKFVQGEDLTCNTPISTYIMPSDGMGNLLPGGPLIASFGFWGGTPITTTVSGQVDIPLNLYHTAVETQTFDLKPIESERGWSYSWSDLAGNPITQLQVGPLAAPIYSTYQPNLRLVGSGLPTCTRLQDSLHLTATLVTTPTVAATTTTLIQVMPDPAVCSLADVGIAQSASAATVQAGDWITFTLTITNYETFTVSVAVADVLSSAQAIAAITLPPGCTLSGTTVTCSPVILPAGGSVELAIAVKSSVWFTGIETSSARAEPIAATDSHFYDNATGPVEVAVTGGMTLNRLFLPLLIH